MIQNIVFDMGNVLILYDANRYVNEHIEVKEDRQIILEELFGSVDWLQLDRGIVTQEEVVRSVCARIPERLHKAVSFLLDNWHEDIPSFPEMEDLIRELKRNEYGVYLLSNTSKKYHHFRKYLPAIELFDGELISADYGLLKPDRAIFDVFYVQMGISPQTCFFVDDSTANVEGAIRTGMQGFVYRGDIHKLRAALRQAGVKVEE